MFHVDAHFCERRHIFQCCVHHEWRMIHQQSLDAALSGLRKQRPNLIDMQMAGRKNGIMFGNEIQDRKNFFSKLPMLIERRQWFRFKKFFLCLWKFILEVSIFTMLINMIGCRKRRHPYETRAQLQAVINRVNIKTADRII